jgi:hypothetical protein
MQRVGVDILGPLPPTADGNKYILVFSDYFTKWVEAIPIKNQEATTIADALLEFITRFGIPGEIHSDQGRQFISRIFDQVCARLGIVKTRTAPYHPQSDGMVERFNRTLLSALSKCVDCQTNWDKIAPIICLYYRATVHASTGVTPAMLMLGRELTLPIDVVFPPPEEEAHESYPQYLQEMERNLEIASEYARAHLRLAHESMRMRNAPARDVKPLDITRPVYVFNPAVKKGQSPKLNRVWKGPHQIVECISPYLYRVAVGGRRGTQVIHRSNLYQSRA